MWNATSKWIGPHRFIFIGIAVALLYWFAETLLYYFLFNAGQRSFPQALCPWHDLHEIWMRSFICVLFVAFVLYAHFAMQAQERLHIALTVWCGITAAWLTYHEKLSEDKTMLDEEEKRLLADLIAISTSVDGVKTLGVPAEMGRQTA